MIVEIGHFALIIALMVAAVQAVVPLWGAHKGWYGWMALADPAARAQFFLVAISFGALTYAFVVSDFSVQLVATNSHSMKPMLYKVTGVWGNHEGSLLLWVLILVFFGALVSWYGRGLPPSLKARVLSVQAMITVAFLLFTLFTSNPFERLAFPPLDGQDLNPLLQDPGLAFHPPFLYLGYVGLSIAFSFAVAALIEGRVDAAWGRWVRPWTLAAWMFLTLGIALGSWWAYYELGWGGWWFWDPVENASFMPWLFATALLHSAIVVEKRESMKSWTILLAILAFSFSLIGTFIVRSGILTSVHAFALDPDRGMFLLAIFAFFTGGALTLYAFRAPALASRGVFGIVSREAGLLANNILLTVASLVVFVGTMWPLVMEMTTGRRISVGPPFFDTAFTPFMVAMAMILPLAALLPWKRGSVARSMRPLWGVLALSLALGALVWSIQTGGRMLAPIGIALAAWLVLGAFVDLWSRARGGEVPLRDTLRRLRNLPRADYGKATAHAGLGLLFFGIAAITAWEIEDVQVMDIGDTVALERYEIRLDDVREVQGPNYISTMAFFAVLRDGREIATLTPEKRFYPVARMPTTEAAMHHSLRRDVYLVIGDPQDAGGWAVRLYLKPFVNWIWIGSIVMALGAILSLTDRRFRIAPGAQRMTGEGRTKEAAGAVPAE